MNLLFLIFSYKTGGIERLLIDTANEMQKRGHRVSLCIINDTYDSELLTNYQADIRLFRLERPTGPGSRLPYMKQLATIVAIEQIDLIHCQDLNCVVFSLLAKLRRPQVKIIDSVHDTMVFATYPGYKILLERLLCSRIIAISKSVEKEILLRGIPQKQVAVIYNAIITEKYQPKQHQKCFSPDQVVLGNVARILPHIKGQGILLEALRIVKEKHPSIRCLFAGEAAKENRADYEALLDYTRVHHLEEQVQFCGNVSDVPAFLATIDIFVLPSISEGFGISLIEAMSMGIPCIASDISGPAEIITSETVGVLFESKNPADLAEKIDYVISNYTHYQKEEISNFVKTRFDISQMVDSLLVLYGQVLR